MSTFRYVPPPREAPIPPRRAHPPNGHREHRPEHRNVTAVLSLGATRYVLFRGVTYRVPPISFTEGQRILDLHVRAETLIRALVDGANRETEEDYYLTLRHLARRLWSNCQPASRMLRALRRVGLARNPFRNATEKELQELADFFLQGRTTSSVQYISDRPAS